FKDFLDFLTRMNDAGINRKTMESLIMAGCFDSLGKGRHELMENFERAMNYVHEKLSFEASRSGMLFQEEDLGIYPDFDFLPFEEFPNQEMLRAEKELLGFFFSAHPMDEYKMIWERSSTLDLGNLEQESVNHEYVVVALLKEFRSYTTQNGRRMAFGKLEDYNGSIEIVVFPDLFEKNEASFVKDRVLCLQGVLDNSRRGFSFKVQAVLDPTSLKSNSWRELHIRLTDAAIDETALYPLRDALYSIQGKCRVIFHVPLKGGGETLIEAGASTRCSASDEDLAFIERQTVVAEVWRE
ncbi:MAG: OB-fold nucleic acid binding domain-containing protein, partial [Rectinema sp.]